MNAALTGKRLEAEQRALLRRLEAGGERGDAMSDEKIMAFHNALMSSGRKPVS